MKNAKIYYGWAVTFACFLCNFCSTGLVIYSFSLFVVPMAEKLGVGRTQITIGSSLFTLCIGFFSIFAGSWVQKGHVKRLILLGMTFLAGGNLLLANTKSLVFFYIWYLFIGTGTAFIGPAVTSTLAANWFQKRRGLATGIISCGASVCAMTMPKLITFVMEISGITSAYITCAIVVIICCGIAFFTIKTKPEDMGLYQDGSSEEKVKQKQVTGSAAMLPGLTRTEAMKKASFWALGIAFACLGFGQIGIMHNHAAYLADLSYAPQAVASALAFIGLFGAISTVINGWLGDKLNPKLIFCMGNGLLILAAIVLINIRPNMNFGVLVLYALLFGFGIGVWASAMPLIVINTLGPAFFGAIWGTIFAIRSFWGDTLGAPMVSRLAEGVGYKGAFIAAMIALLISSLLTISAGKPKELEK